MTTGYYKVPISFESLMNRVDLPKTNLQDSIKQYLKLIIVTRFGELDSDVNFGCKIWEDDFSLGTNLLNYTEELKEHLQHVIFNYEKRLSDVKVNLLISQEVLGDQKGSSIKTRLDIEIKAVISKTNAPFQNVYSMYISPYASI